MIFDLDGGGRAFVDPLWVSGVREIERRGRGPDPHLIAVIVTRGGGEYPVSDPERNVIDRIAAAKSAAGNIAERVAMALEGLGLVHGADG